VWRRRRRKSLHLRQTQLRGFVQAGGEPIGNGIVLDRDIVRVARRNVPKPDKDAGTGKQPADAAHHETNPCRTGGSDTADG